MKDKEKQIEEIKKYCCWYNKGKCLANCGVEDICDLNCGFGQGMETLIEQGYRKLPKDSVVLSREEYEKKKKHLQNVLELSSFQLENVVKENEKLKEQLKDKKLLTEENYNKLCHLAYFGYDDAYEKGSKETAEKIIDLIKTFCPDKKFIEVITRIISERFGVEIKE